MNGLNSLALGAHPDHTALLDAHAPDLDAVILLTGGDHTPVLAALADRRLPTLTEKPLAYTRADAARITQAFAATTTPLQVGYMKRHYPAVSRLQEVISTHAVSALTIDLVHPPEDTYLIPVIGHGRAVTGDLASFLDGEAARPEIGQTLAELDVPETDTATRRGYVLLATSVIHDLNLMRALLGAPARVAFAHFWNGGLSGQAILEQGPERTARLTYTYVATGGYTETVNLTAPDGRWTLHLPSPYLSHAPAALTTVRDTTTGLPITTNDPVSLDAPFHRQLQAFHHAVTIGDRPIIDGNDTTADLDLAEQIVTVAARHDTDVAAVRW
jgi:myo-inositol 2-dehydrogenase/D-chiro-inositol 1-dehydrogenase